MLLVVPDRRLWLLSDAVTGHDMHYILLVSDRPLALFAGFRTRLALLQMSGIGLHRHVQIAVLAILGLLVAPGLMPLDVG